jgi:soluble lytic murein transglycosylase-like protein
MPPVPEFHDTEARLRYLQWQATTSLKLSQIKTDPMERREYLQTVWFESRRAGLSPSLVLSMTDQLSGFRKFNTSAIGARGYMSVLPGITRRLSDGDAASLFHMQTNYRYGCVMLRHYIERRKGDVHAALLDYLAEASINRPRNDKQVIATAREILKGRAKWRVLPDD